MRKLKLDEPMLRRVLDDLDAQDAAWQQSPSANSELYGYRVPSLRVEFSLSRDEVATQTVPARKLAREGIYFLTAALVHECPCRIHLVTVKNNWQTVTGRVVHCRYISGTSGLYEVYATFDNPIDPASFAPHATRTRILAVDDSLVSRKLYEHLLETMNVDLNSFADALSGVKEALTHYYDVVLMDIEMPELDGLTAVRMLRGKGYVRAIVAVSALSDEEARNQCMEAGFDDFLAKPLTRESLAAVVIRNRPEPLVSNMLEDPGMAELIDSFVMSLGQNISELEAAYGNEDREGLSRVTRTLKGEAAGIGFPPITQAAAAIEEALKQGGPLSQIRNRLIELIRLCMAARPATQTGSNEANDKKAEGEEAPEGKEEMVGGTPEQPDDSKTSETSAATEQD